MWWIVQWNNRNTQEKTKYPNIPFNIFPWQLHWLPHSSSSCKDLNWTQATGWHASDNPIVNNDELYKHIKTKNQLKCICSAPVQSPKVCYNWNRSRKWCNQRCNQCRWCFKCYKPGWWWCWLQWVWKDCQTCSVWRLWFWYCWYWLYVRMPPMREVFRPGRGKLKKIVPILLILRSWLIW